MKALPVSLQLSAALLLAFSVSSAHADIFKWTDAQGNIHYSQTPPQDKKTKAEDIAEDIEMAAGKGGSGDKESGKTEAEGGDEIANARKKGEKNKVKHKTFCKQQKSALKQLLANPVIKWKSDKEERILTAKEREGKINEFEKNIKDMCNADVLASKEKVGVQ